MLQTGGHTLTPADLIAIGTGRPVAEPTPSSGFDLIAAIETMLHDGGKDVYDRVVKLVERELFNRALRMTHGHQAQASELLGINRTTLRHKLRELGLSLDKVVADRGDVEG